MSAAASTTTSPVIVPDGALSALLAAVEAVDLSTASAPPIKGRCKHYKAVGPANDFIRRLTIYRNQLVDGLNARLQECRDELDKKAAIVKGNPQDEAAAADLYALNDTFENELSAMKQPVDLLASLLRFEMVGQYPEVAAADELAVDSDWNVGWYPGHEDGTIEREVMGSIGSLISLIFGDRRERAFH